MERAKHYIQESLNYYAAFFAGIAQDSEEMVEKSLKRIRATDSLAEEQLQAQELDYYRKRRTYLMRIFRQRLTSELQVQVEKSLIDEVEKLVDNRSPEED